ncbi:LacI family DNA-binding transcriptional regulator [Falsiroseomonas sp. HC035]|uniref:LacI family DNA-binding transcriptional regulator n=1 Tax=Falsiroseomonas sp. HC035 TaxID=3390999 RepID=UPI003D315D60
MADRITLIDVAQHAGVSRATVSLVLRDSPLIASATKARVRRSLKALGYLYNRGAATMRASGTKTIGLLVNQIDNPFFAELTDGISAALDAAGYIAFLSVVQDSVERQQRAILRLREHRVDGLILCPAVGTEPEQIAQLGKFGLPVVQTMRMVPGSVGDYAGPDNEPGTALLAEHLIGLGHRSFAYAGGVAPHSGNRERVAGVVGALRRHGLAPLEILRTEGTRVGGMEAAAQIDAMDRRPTALICGNDIVALGAILGLQQRGVVIGRDIAVTGIGNVPEAAICQPGLTTLATNPRIVGQEAVRLLLRRIVNPAVAAEAVAVPVRLVVRASCGAVTKASRSVAPDTSRDQRHGADNLEVDEAHDDREGMG